jgi:hypothetical protein
MEGQGKLDVPPFQLAFVSSSKVVLEGDSHRSPSGDPAVEYLDLDAMEQVMNGLRLSDI